ncbi:hypothetical protein AURDEDRAFT_125595 [Auricularia subglabra TFB-10046 SS5]|nr:hypothetical protein AURDEDRAFT_125595 [Auricularia subglabra TFB-10046 SS5]
MTDGHQEYRGVGERDTLELQWVSLHGFLRDSGYELRARYQPAAVLICDGGLGSWANLKNSPFSTDKFEDGAKAVKWNVLNAVGAWDSLHVCMKRIEANDAPEDHAQYFSTMEDEPRNHCCTILDVPSPLDGPIGISEAVELFSQVFETEPYASVRPIRHYFIDFESSIRFHSRINRQLHIRDKRAVRTAPEENGTQRLQPCNPFALDVYCLGSLIREHWLKAYKNVDFMRPLVADMMHPNPSRRPPARQVVERFAAIHATPSPKDLKRRLRQNLDYFTDRVSTRQLLEIIELQRRNKAHAAGKPYGFKEHVMYLFGGRPKPPAAGAAAQREAEAFKLVLGL